MELEDVMELASGLVRAWPTSEPWPDDTQQFALGLLAAFTPLQVARAVVAISLERDSDGHSRRFAPAPGEIASKVVSMGQPQETFGEVWLEILRARKTPKPWRQCAWSVAAKGFLEHVGWECLEDLSPTSETPLSIIQGQLRVKWDAFVEKRDRLASYEAITGGAGEALMGRADVPALPEVLSLADRMPRVGEVRKRAR